MFGVNIADTVRPARSCSGNPENPALTLQRVDFRARLGYTECALDTNKDASRPRKPAPITKGPRHCSRWWGLGIMRSRQRRR